MHPSMIIFCLVFIKKINQIKFFLKKLKSVQIDRFWFGFLGKKPVQTSLAQFFLFGSVFFRFFSVLIWFGFFNFKLIKPKPNWSVF
jgi:hypothetical protein